MKSERVQVKAVWQDFMPNGKKYTNGDLQYSWIDDEGAVAVLRGSLGVKRLTVWLPSGAKVVCSLPRMQSREELKPDHKFIGNYFGRPGDRRRTVFTIIKGEQ